MCAALFCSLLVFMAASTACASSSSPAQKEAAESPHKGGLQLERNGPQAAFKGGIQLAVDITDTRRRIARVSERIPVQLPGRTILFYPQWEAASHAPSISAHRLAGLVIKANGKQLQWFRDPGRVHAFAVNVPAGAYELEAEFQYLAPLGRDASATILDGFVGLSWNRVLLYPAGWSTGHIPVQATVRLPEGMLLASSLKGSQQGSVVQFEQVPLDQLIDAPVFASRHVDSRQISGGTAPVRAHWIAQSSDAIKNASNLTLPLRRVVNEVESVFGAPPFEKYDFLFGIDDRLPGPGGIEHATSSEVFLPTDAISDLSSALPYIDVIPHELIHAWNGMWRVPADMASPTLNDPITGTLLWVYEGQTEFWSRVIGARAGLRSLQETLDAIAVDAAIVQTQAGRRWKSLADSTNDPLIQSGPASWRDWQRREDYYVEGVLFWLDIDARLRQCSHGAKGMDDFAAAFFSTKTKTADEHQRTYTEAGVVNELERLCSNNWSQLLSRKLDTHDSRDVLDGLTNHGWRLVYRDVPTPYFRANEASDGVADLSWSAGLTVTTSGLVKAVAWEGPAFAAGAVPGSRVKSVNGAPFSLQALRDAVALTTSAKSLQLRLLIDGQEVDVDVQGVAGHRYPALERVENINDSLSKLLSSRTRVDP